MMKRFTIAKHGKGEGAGHYRTKDTILQVYDAMAEAIRTGKPCQTHLDPPPGPPCDTQGNFIPTTQWDSARWPRHIHQPRPAAEEAPRTKKGLSYD